MISRVKNTVNNASIYMSEGSTIKNKPTMKTIPEQTAMVIPSNKKYNLSMSVFVSTRAQLLIKNTKRENKIATPMNINTC